MRCQELFLAALCISAFVATFNVTTMMSRRHQIHVPEEEIAGDGLPGKELSGQSSKTLLDQTATDGKPHPVQNLKRGPVLRGVVKRPDELAHRNRKKRMFHTAVTANDGPYNKWQCRIMYFYYKKFAAMEGSEMGGFTRVLHSGRPDNLMDEIPTWIAQPLAAGLDRGYVVLNRPWAFVQWVQQVEIEEEYVLMAEPDHIFVKPLPNLATEFMPAAFPFFYITPKENEALLRRWIPEGPITQIDPIGNSPSIIKKTDLAKVVALWSNVSIAMKEDPKTDKTFGWVLEMYGYATAAAMVGIQHILRKDFMIQPPWDTVIGDAFIIHYTYGCDYTLKGEMMYGKFGEWRFDKRSYSGGAPPRNLTMPPEGCPEAIKMLISKINDATFQIPDWREGAT
eukprot:TRINITY_DN399_c0_g1_i1.p1 TRINITY_DN399_c0_g1~~TRINITY_DN399_c0_g1_i1.p1  ORF type:complete len:395 (+),score=43.66 TRINITY_DN399_c0_g1_i1:184-1368(+)